MVSYSFPDCLILYMDREREREILILIGVVVYLESLIIVLLFQLQVAWIHIDRQMILTIHRHVISRVPRFSVSHDNAKTWLLHVSSVQQEDRGYYMCQVNTNPMISQVGYLQVVGKQTSNYFYTFIQGSYHSY